MVLKSDGKKNCLIKHGYTYLTFTAVWGDFFMSRQK